MYKQFYAGMDWSHLPLFALWLFLAIFCGVCAWVFVAKRARHFDAVAQLPLQDSAAPAPGIGGNHE